MKKFGIKCLGNKIIVRPYPLEDKTESGLIVIGAENILQFCRKGEVVSAGKKSTVKVGDEIFFGNNAIERISFEGEHYFSMKDENVLGKINDSAFGLETNLNRLIVEQIKPEEVTKSGIYFQPDKEQLKKGKVIVCTNECSVIKGEIVVFNHDVGAPLKHKGKDYLVMRDDNLMAIMRDDNLMAIVSNWETHGVHTPRIS